MSRVFARMREATPVKKEKLAQLEPQLRDDLLHAQDDLVGRDFPVIVTLDGDDFTGCEDVFEILHAWFDARYLRSEAFGPATDDDRARPWLFRFWKVLPPRGTVGIWLRSWATSIVTARVAGKLDDAELERRIEEARRTEEMLVADGALLIKIWLRVPKKTLKKRLAEAREADAWRSQTEDEAVLENWDECQEVAGRVVDGTDGKHAPWLVIDGAQARARTVAVARAIAQVMRARLDLPSAAVVQEPPPERLAADPVTMLDRVEQPEPLDEEDYERVLERWQGKLSRLHREAFARGVGSVFVFEGQDAAGKGGAIRRVTRALDAPKYKVFPIGAPDERERSRHWLWRFWHRLPRAGSVAIFDRSWYGRVLVERVEGFATRAAWRRALREIEDFEAQIVGRGCVLAKFWLHVSPREQLRRFQERATMSFKRYKLGPDDWRNRERAHDYEAAAVEMFDATRSVAPWHVIPSDDKRSARIDILKRTCAALEARLREV